MNFGLPSRRTRRTEKFDFAVLTMLPEPTVKGGSRKFALNSAARTLLGINKEQEAFVSIGVPQENTNNFFIANTTNVTGIRPDYKYAVHTTDWTFSNRKMYYYMVKEMNLNTNEENHFIISENNGNFILTPYNSNAASTGEIASASEVTTENEIEELTL